MLCSIIMCGRLGENLETPFRYVEFDRLLRGKEKQITDKIPVCPWDKSDKSSLFTMKQGTLVLVSGSLERDEKIGLYVLSDAIHYLGDKQFNKL